MCIVLLDRRQLLFLGFMYLEALDDDSLAQQVMLLARLAEDSKHPANKELIKRLAELLKKVM